MPADQIWAYTSALPGHGMHARRQLGIGEIEIVLRDRDQGRDRIWRRGVGLAERDLERARGLWLRLALGGRYGAVDDRELADLVRIGTEIVGALGIVAGEEGLADHALGRGIAEHAHHMRLGQPLVGGIIGRRLEAREARRIEFTRDREL